MSTPPPVDPLQRFAHERQRARQADDPMAHLCTVANTDADNQPQLRTLVLREVADRLAIFVNANSPKWPHLQNTFAVLTYWPSVQIQYRLQVQGEMLAADVVHESWLLRPDPPKRMDWYYEQFAKQSRAITDRQTLLQELQEVQLPDPLAAPTNARGMLLQVLCLERLDLTQPDGVHQRERHSRTADGWQVEVLVP